MRKLTIFMLLSCLFLISCEMTNRTSHHLKSLETEERLESAYQFARRALYVAPSGCEFSSPVQSAVSIGNGRISLDLLCRSKTSGWGGDQQKIVLNTDDLSVVRRFKEVDGLVCKGPRLQHLLGDQFVLACAVADESGNGAGGGEQGRIELWVVDYSNPEVSIQKKSVLTSNKLPVFSIYDVKADDRGRVFVSYGQKPAGVGNSVSVFGLAAFELSNENVTDLGWPPSANAEWCDRLSLCLCDDVLLTPQQDLLLLCSLNFNKNFRYVSVGLSSDGHWYLRAQTTSDQFSSSQSGQIAGGKHFKYFDKVYYGRGKGRLEIRDANTMQLIASRFPIGMDGADRNIGGISPLNNGDTLAMLSDYAGDVSVSLLDGSTLEDKETLEWRRLLGKIPRGAKYIPFGLVPDEDGNSFFLVSGKEISKVTLR